jgi:hypothetical protein
MYIVLSNKHAALLVGLATVTRIAAMAFLLNGSNDQIVLQT